MRARNYICTSQNEQNSIIVKCTYLNHNKIACRLQTEKKNRSTRFAEASIDQRRLVTRVAPYEEHEVGLLDLGDVRVEQVGRAQVNAAPLGQK